MAERPLTYEEMTGWRFICVTHQWMSNRVPCPGGCTDCVDAEDEREADR
jgi:hypothetical protein